MSYRARAGDQPSCSQLPARPNAAFNHLYQHDFLLQTGPPDFQPFQAPASFPSQASLASQTSRHTFLEQAGAWDGAWFQLGPFQAGPATASTAVQCSPVPPSPRRVPAAAAPAAPLSDALLLALRRSRPNTRLFRALFQYIPLRDSPNDNPHLELPLQAGDYVLVHGQMDEDQFYFGETLSGRTGLVPSNYVERVPDQTLLQNASRAPSPQCLAVGVQTAADCGCDHNLPSTSEGLCRGAHPHRTAGSSNPASRTGSRPGSPRHLAYQASALDGPRPNGVLPNAHQTQPQQAPPPSHHQPEAGSATARPLSPSFTISVPPHLSQIAHDFTDDEHTPLPDSVCPYPPVDVSKVTVQEIRHPDQPKVAAPRELTVEKRLSRSAVFSWLPPEDQLAAVAQYHVCVDGVVKAVVPGTYKCKALVEDLVLERAVNVSVRALTDQGHSADAACTLAVGAEAPVAPQHVRVTGITPISACVSWYPSNSGTEHILLLNALKVGVCPPSIFQVQLLGLTPSTIYRISVRTKHPKAVLEQRPVERCVDFKTLPKIGLPDPPLNVQVEPGPQPGTLLVSWRPVTTQPRPPSRAAVHSYLIYADGQNIAQVTSATADHVLLRLADFSDDPPIFVTVRTRTKEGAVSADSNVVRVPRHALGPTGVGLPPPAEAGMQFGAGAAFGADQFAAAPNSNGLLAYGQEPGAAPAQVQQGLLGMLPTVANQCGAAVYPPAQAPVYMTRPVLPPDSIYCPTMQPVQRVPPAAQLQQMPAPTMPAMPFDEFNKFDTSVLPVSNVQFRPAVSRPHPHKLLGRQSTSALLHNNGSLSLPKYASMFEWKQPQQTSQYYTFHPKALYKEYASAAEKPSVLEMENNYLLRHRQQQQRMPGGAAYEVWPSGEERVEYFARHTEPTRRMHGARGVPLMSASHIEPGISRVKSEEMLGTRSEPDLRPSPLGDDNCRWFVALFNYDHHMSPNPNAAQEELSFRKHQLIKVFGDVDQDGFYRGQIGRRTGLVPSNMVIEIAKDDVLSYPRRPPPEEFISRTMERKVDPNVRRSRWGSAKSRSYDYPDRRPYQAGYASEGYSSLDRRDRGRYDYYDNYQPTTSIRPGAYAPKHIADREPRYERSASYEPRGGYREAREARDGREGKEYRDQSYPRDFREARDYYGRRDVGPPPPRKSTYDYDERREPAASVRGGDRYDYQSDRERGYGRDAQERDYQANNGYGGHKQSESSAPGYGAPPKPEERRGLYQQQSAGSMQRGGPPAPQQAPPQQQQQPPQPLQQQPQAAGAPQGYANGNHVTPPEQAGQNPAIVSLEESLRNVDMLPTTRMVAKYDYDSRRLSPNVDAEQVELSFREGDVLTLYGDVDEDGFYIGELNGVRGLVPSNFLMPLSTTNLANHSGLSAPNATAAGIMAGPVGAYGPPNGHVEAGAARPKGVAFSDGRRPGPVRQTSQTSAKTVGTPPAAAAAKNPKSAGAVATGTANKPGGKKSDAAKPTGQANNARKSSQAVKKDAGKKK